MGHNATSNLSTKAELVANPTELRSMCRAYTPQVVKRWGGIVNNPRSSDRDAIAAGQALMERGWGRAPLDWNSEDGIRLHAIIQHVIVDARAADMGRAMGSDAKPVQVIDNATGVGDDISVTPALPAPDQGKT